MKRKGIIISNPGDIGAENYCEGVKKDVANYRSFLLSANGGLWRESEIEEMGRPSVADVRRKIESLPYYDYVLVIFSGHGYHCTTRDSTVLDLRNGHEIDSAELREGARKQTMILDCCRQKYPVKPTAMMDAARVAKSAPTINPEECRRYYNNRIEECPNGLVVMHSCDVDELSGDDSAKGGYYSYSLLEVSKAWAHDSTISTSREVGYFSVATAHENSVPRVRALSGTRQQNPQIEKPRTSPHYPFCIVA